MHDLSAEHVINAKEQEVHTKYHGKLGGLEAGCFQCEAEVLPNFRKASFCSEATVHHRLVQMTSCLVPRLALVHGEARRTAHM